MRKTKGYLRSLERKQWIAGMRVVGIDPARDKHQAVVLDECTFGDVLDYVD